MKELNSRRLITFLTQKLYLHSEVFLVNLCIQRKGHFKRNNSKEWHYMLIVSCLLSVLPKAVVSQSQDWCHVLTYYGKMKVVSWPGEHKPALLHLGTEF